MTNFDRRTIVKAGAVLGIGAGTPLCMPLALRAAGPPHGVFVVDRRFAASVAAAVARSERGAVVIDPREEDLGICWRKRIPGLLAQRGHIVEGMTLWSDLFVCQTFARAHGLSLAGPPRPVHWAPASGLLLWTLAEPAA